MNNKKFGSFIKELRKERNLTQEDLAKEFVVDRGTISKWERGEYIPSSDILLKISEYFDLTINELLAGEKLNKDNKEVINKITVDVLKEKEKKTKIIKRIATTSILIILLLILSFLSYYFINNYNSISVHNLSGETERFNIDDGIMIISKQKVYIKIGEIQTYEENEINYIRLYYKKNNKEYEIYKNSKIEMTIVNIFGEDELFKYEDINYIKQNLYVDVIYNNEEKTETIKISVKEDFINDEIFDTKLNYEIEETKINSEVPEYIRERFEYNKEDNSYYRIINNKNVIIVEKYFYDSQIYIIEEQYDEYINYFEYYVSDKNLYYYKLLNGNMENSFTYNLETEKCTFGICDLDIINVFKNEYYSKI